MTDTISLPAAVEQSILGAQPAYALLGMKDRLGVNYAQHGHAFTAEDWAAMMYFFDKHLRGQKVDRAFDRFPTEAELDEAASGRAGSSAYRSAPWKVREMPSIQATHHGQPDCMPNSMSRASTAMGA